MQELIKSENISYSYKSDDGITVKNAVSDISFSVRPGEYVAILGHNGSGKSTFAKLLNLILIADNGKLIIDGKEIIPSKNMSEDEIYDVHKKIGMVFQSPDNQLVATIVEEDVAFGPENLGIEPNEIRERVNNALGIVNMTEYVKHSTHSLSGGQKQRIAIAGVLAMKPKCIIFDESTAMLDPLGRKEVMSVINKLTKEDKITVLHITHYMDEAALADRIVVINDGSIIMDDTPRNVFSRVDQLQKVGLEAPQGTELLHKLKKKGYDLPLGIIDSDECVDAICKILEERRQNG